MLQTPLPKKTLAEQLAMRLSQTRKDASPIKTLETQEQEREEHKDIPNEPILNKQIPREPILNEPKEIESKPLADKASRPFTRPTNGCRPICILYEDEERTADLIKALDREGAPEIHKWLVTAGTLDLKTPPSKEMLYFSRLSASASIRKHESAIAYGEHVLQWLDHHGCEVVNGALAFSLEISKVRQCLALAKHGLAYPDTLLIASQAQIAPSVEKWYKAKKPPIFYLKPVTGGSGDGVRRYTAWSEFKRDFVDRRSSKTLKGAGAIFIAQKGEEEHETWIDKIKKGKIKGEKKVFYRAEFVDRQLLYCLRVSIPVTVNSSCPCDAPTRFDTSFTVIQDPATHFEDPEGWPRFEAKCQAFMKNHGMHIGAFEFSRPVGPDVSDFTNSKDYFIYDVNANTNYSDHAEKKIDYGERGMVNQARMLIRMACKKHQV